MEKARILIVEDEELVALAIKTCLDGNGHLGTYIVTSGEEAIEAVPKFAPDLVLMDIHLQGPMTGIEAARLIRNAHRIPVVYLTAYSDEKTLGEAKVTEPYGYILKPFDERSLLAAIEMALYRASTQSLLRRTKDNMEGILRSVREGIVVTGTKGVVEFMNANALALLDREGPPTPDTTIFSLCSVFDGETGANALLRLDSVVLDGKSVSLTDCVIVTPGKKRFTADLDLSPYRDDRGRAKGIVITIRDVTERRTIPERIGRELQGIACSHQRLLPPDGLVINGWQLHGFMLPATFGGGDIYDFFGIDDQYAAFYLIDVMGHGLSASSTALLLNRLLVPDEGEGNRFKILDVDPRRPSAVVEKLNHLLYSAGLLFFTICYGVIDTKKGLVTMARGGHPRPLVAGKTGLVREIEGGEGAIGLSRHMSYAEFRVPLGESERLYCYTDGLTGSVDAKGEDFGQDRLRALVSVAAVMDPAAGVASIRRAFEAWKAASQVDDDATLIVLHRSDSAPA